MSLPKWLRRRSPNDIDVRIARTLNYRALTHFQVHTKELPHYRFVDLHRAVEAFCQNRGDVAFILSEHNEDLNALLHLKRDQWTPRCINRSRSLPWPTGPHEEAYLPVDGFWLCGVSPPPELPPVIIRL